jgi:hypothetical protein
MSHAAPPSIHDMRGRCMTRRHRQSGATMVEFVIVAPLAFLFVLALIQVGFLQMAKLTLNHATFMAARHGAVSKADYGEIRDSLAKGLIPFFQDATESSDITRMGKAWGYAKLDVYNPMHVDLKILSPSPAAFKDFGVKDDKGKIYIPNDNLEWRSGFGPTSKMNIQDANLLKIKVVYGYELKVPLMKFMVSRIMCGGSGGVQAFGGDVPVWSALGSVSDCLTYYKFGRVPIVSYAIVEMQSPAYQ